MPEPIVLFPGAIDSAQSLLAPFNVYKWKSFLKIACDASETVLTLTDGDDLTDIYNGVAGNYIGIQSEIMFCESVDNTGADKKITVIRGRGDSVAASHLVGELVQQVFTAQLHTQLRTAIIAIETQIGVSPISATTINLLPDSDPYDTVFSGHSGMLYDLLVSAKDSSGLNKSAIIHRINHWGDSVNTPETMETFISFIGSGVSSEITNLVAGADNVTVRINGCNGGSAKIVVKTIGEVL
jgi:hypothetical protein